MNLDDMPIAELAPAPYNPRKDLGLGDRDYESRARSYAFEPSPRRPLSIGERRSTKLACAPSPPK